MILKLKWLKYILINEVAFIIISKRLHFYNTLFINKVGFINRYEFRHLRKGARTTFLEVKIATCALHATVNEKLKELQN